SDIHCEAYNTEIDLHAALRTLPPAHDDSKGLFSSLEEILPHYSAASVNTRELIHDRSADDQWEWTRNEERLELTMHNADPVPNFMISSPLPSPFSTFGAQSYRLPILGVLALLILALVLAIAQFIARRVVLVVVIRPTAMGVITNAILHGQEHEAWSRILSSFVWVNGSQINADAQGVSFSGSYQSLDDSAPSGNGKGLVKRLTQRLYLATGFGN